MFHSYRSHIIFVVLILFLAVPLIALGATDASPQKMLALTMFNNYVNDLPGFFNRLMNMSIFIGALLAVVMISIGGVQYMTSEAVGSIENAKQRITHAILGLLMLLSVYIFYNQINPDILKLDFTLKTANVDASKPAEPKPAPKPFFSNPTIIQPGDIQKKFTECGTSGTISCTEAIKSCQADQSNVQITSSPKNNGIYCSTVVTVADYKKAVVDTYTTKTVEGLGKTVLDISYSEEKYKKATPAEKKKYLSDWGASCKKKGGRLNYIQIVTGGVHYQHVCVK